MRRHHQPARHRIGDPASVVTTQQVQAAVDSRRGAGRGRQLAVLDVEHRGIQANLRVAPGKMGRALPVRSRAAAIEQAGFRQHVGAQTEPDDVGTAPVGGDQRSEQFRWRPFVGITPARHDHGARPGDRREAVLDVQGESGRCPQRRFVDRKHAQREGRHAGMGLAKHHAGHGEMEGADAIEGEHRDNVTRHVCHLKTAKEILARS